MLKPCVQAESYIREAVEMYEALAKERLCFRLRSPVARPRVKLGTFGMSTCLPRPLTASAYHELGKCLWGQRRREDAQKARG